MLPGPVRVVIPKGGKKPVKLHTWASGNNKGAKYWSDGKVDGPMMPNFPALLRSSAENILFWCDECTQIAEYEMGDKYWDRNPYIPSNCKTAVFAIDPKKEDFYLALVRGLVRNAEDEIYLRRSIWWADNDPVRKGQSSTQPNLDRWNLRQLLELYKSESIESVWIAEIYRQLALFDECLEQLESPWPSDLKPYVNLIRQKAKLKDSFVAQV
jgi:hypothetical protein